MKTGSVIINGITDADLRELLKLKEQQRAGIQFDQHALQIVATEALLGRAPMSI